MFKYYVVVACALCALLPGIAGERSIGKPRVNAPVFKKLDKGINIDTAVRDSGVWPKIQHDPTHFQAAAGADGQTYKISFIAASEDGEGRMKIMLKGAKYQNTIYDSSAADGECLKIGKEPRAYTKFYKDNAEIEMDARLEFDVGSRQQILYLDKVDFIRH